MMKCSFIRVPLFATGIAVTVAAVMSIVVLTGAPAFGYSLAEAQSYQQRKDWDGLLRYSKAWSQAEPNNSNAWAMVSGAYFFGFNRPDLALEPTKRAVALSPRKRVDGPRSARST